MKKVNYILIALLMTALGFQSCDFNDLEPNDSVNNPFQDLYGVEKTVNGAYSSVRQLRILRLAEYIADDTKPGGQAGGAGGDSNAWSYTAGTGDHNTVWNEQYQTINLVNRIIMYAPSVKADTDEDKARLNNYLAHAYFLRAYSHFDLLRFFSDFKNEDALGVPYMLEPTIFGQPGRNKVSACYDYMIADLTKAKELYSEDVSENVAYASKVAADAMLARLYLYRGKYDDARQSATSVLSRVGMATAANYADVWSDKSTAGVILKRRCFASETRLGGMFISQDNSNVFSPSKKYMAVYSEKDIRAKLFFGQGPDREKNIVDIVKKYIGEPTTIGVNDEKLLRAEEMKLIEIECLARDASKTAEANTELNLFRAVKIADWVTTTYTKEQLLDEILLERRRELAFEGHRFFDLRRFGKNIVRDTVIKDGVDITPVLKADNFRQIMPIPQAELEANGGIPKEDQNPGY